MLPFVFSENGKDIWGLAHWHNQQERCKPCRVKLDYIVRTETHDHDAEYIIKEKLRGRGLQSRTKAWRDKVKGEFPYFGRELTEYQEVPDDVFNKVALKYKTDFELFGYSYERSQNGSVITKCDIQGSSCC